MNWPCHKNSKEYGSRMDPNAASELLPLLFCFWIQHLFSNLWTHFTDLEKNPPFFHCTYFPTLHHATIHKHFSFKNNFSSLHLRCISHSNGHGNLSVPSAVVSCIEATLQVFSSNFWVTCTYGEIKTDVWDFFAVILWMWTSVHIYSVCMPLCTTQRTALSSTAVWNDYINWTQNSWQIFCWMSFNSPCFYCCTKIDRAKQLQSHN